MVRLGLLWFYEGRYGPEYTGLFWTGFHRVGTSDVYREQKWGQFLNKNCATAWGDYQPSADSNQLDVYYRAVDYKKYKK